jgi:hypothetical protein
MSVRVVITVAMVMVIILCFMGYYNSCHGNAVKGDL